MYRNAPLDLTEFKNMQQLLLVLHVLIAVSIIALVLLQQGKGAEMGPAFGSSASQTLFGSQGSGSFLMKITALLAFLFFATSLTLGYITAHQAKPDPLQDLAKIANQLPASKPVANTTQPVPTAGIPVPETNFGKQQSSSSNSSQK